MIPRPLRQMAHESPRHRGEVPAPDRPVELLTIAGALHASEQPAPDHDQEVRAWD